MAPFRWSSCSSFFCVFVHVLIIWLWRRWSGFHLRLKLPLVLGLGLGDRVAAFRRASTLTKHTSSYHILPHQPCVSSRFSSTHFQISHSHAVFYDFISTTNRQTTTPKSKLWPRINSNIGNNWFWNVFYQWCVLVSFLLPALIQTERSVAPFRWSSRSS